MDITYVIIGLVAVAAAILIVGLVSLLVGWRILRKLYRVLVQNSGIFGSTPQARLVSLGVAVALFPQMIAGPLDAALRVAETVLSNLSIVWIPVVKALSRDKPEPSLTVILQSLTESLGQLASLTAKSLDLAMFPVTTFLLGLACWSFVGQLLAGSSSGAQGVDWPALIHRISAVTWKNAALFGVLFFGTYLSIAAITAIPSLQKSETPVEADRTRLTEQLKVSRLSKADFDNAFQTPPDTQPFLQLEQALGISENTPPAGASNQSSTKSSEAQPLENKNVSKSQNVIEGKRPSTEGQSAQNQSAVSSRADLIKRLASEDSEFASGIQGAETRWKSEEQVRVNFRAQLESMRNEVYKHEESLQAQVANVFDSGTVGHMAARERSRYIQALDVEFQRRIGAMEGPLRSCSIGLRSLETYWQFFANDLRQAIERDIQTATRSGDSEARGRRFYEISYRLGAGSTVSFRSCESPEYSEFVSPQPPSAVNEWGAFRFFAGWLLRSESLPLAVITGMLGVGLLGAAASSFIRQQAKRQKTDPLVEDLAGVVIRGFSAAIVIFLAVEGGLNIFGTATGEPNPYVLLCTCLVGAVFSEDVWKKAQDWLENGKQKDGNGGDSRKRKNGGQKKDNEGTSTASDKPSPSMDKTTQHGEGNGDDSSKGKNGGQKGDNEGASTASDKSSPSVDTNIQPGEETERS